MARKRKTRTTSSAPPRREVAAPPVVAPKSVHLERAEKYIDDVIAGKIPAGALAKAACQRQRDDLVRLAKHPLYYWDPEKAAKVCRFLERLPHIKGPKANAKELCHLEGWQCFILSTVFGWRRRDTGGRRFKRAYIEVPRGNGKSFISAGLGLYCLSNDGEEGAEVYSAATTRDQAKIVWGDARTMMIKRPEFAKTIGVSVSQHSVYQTRSNSKFVPLSREADNQDGLNVHCAIIDELHAHRTRDTYDVIETASAKRNNSLIWVITTAGTDTSGICYEQRGFVKKILEGLEDETQFGIIYSADEGDDWTDLSTWIKANPNWGVSVTPDAFAALAFKAMQTPSAQSNFKTKHLNLWENADSAAFDLRSWDKCADPTLRIEDFAGQECFVGMDLASKIDIAARARVFVRRVPRVNPPPPTVIEAIAGLAGNPAVQNSSFDLHYYLFVDSFLPEAAIVDGRNSQYSGWDIEGWLTKTPGDVLDFGVVQSAILSDHESGDFVVREVAYDPWQATQMAQELQAKGLTMVEVRPSVQNFSAPMKELDALMRGGRLHHDGNPVMRWMVSNTVGHFDAKDNIYPRKERPENKIDGVIASLMALGRAMLSKPVETQKVRVRFLSG